MKDVLLTVTDSEYSFFINLIKKFDFIQIKKIDRKITSKQKFLDEFKESIEELNLIKEDKLKGRPIQELLNEI